MIYDNSFYQSIDKGALDSARIIVPLVINVFEPKSVIDFGCGTGAWLTAFKECDPNIEIVGVDGSYNTYARLMLGNNHFIAHDLAKPLTLEKKYDLAITLEVAEHLHESSADSFVEMVASASDNILWSAAVPGQRGVNHVNEQFPSYWIPKFERLGFKCNGSFRYLFWYNEEIENWYRQNILLFSKNFDWNEPVRDLIHYNNYSNYNTIHPQFKKD